LKKRVFISRNAADCQEIQAYLPKDIEVITQSLIETTAVPFNKEIPLTDWIFFSSSNGARHFFEQHPIIHHQRFAAIGEATAKAVEEFHQVDFVGNSADITDSAYRFAEALGTETVLFPIAEDSLKHIQSVIPAHQVVDLPVYRTFEKSEGVEACDVYVFSSPSNVRSFFRGNPHSTTAQQPCIAYGKATEEELSKHGVENITIPASLEARSIAYTIIQALQG
jgi:hydroxymethylbilane synthase